MPVLTLTQLQDLFHPLTVTMTGLDASAVRHAYQGGSQPSFERTQACAFIHLTEVDEPINRTRDLIYSPDDADSVLQATYYTRVFQAQWTLYGPTAYDLADTIRFKILTESIRATLAASAIYPIPDIPAPSRVPFPRNGQWWERADLFVRFNCGTTRTETVPTLASTVIEVHTEDGLQNSFQA